MKTAILCSLSFLAGSIVIGLPASIIIMTSYQDTTFVQNKIYTRTIELASQNKTDDLIKLSCIALQNCLEVYEELDDDLLVFNGPAISEEQKESTNAKAQAIVENEVICGRT